MLVGEPSALLQGTANEAGNPNSDANKPPDEQKNPIRAEIPVHTPSNQGGRGHFGDRLPDQAGCPHGMANVWLGPGGHWAG